MIGNVVVMLETGMLIGDSILDNTVKQKVVSNSGVYHISTLPHLLSSCATNIVYRTLDHVHTLHSTTAGLAAASEERC